MFSEKLPRMLLTKKDKLLPLVYQAFDIILNFNYLLNYPLDEKIKHYGHRTNHTETKRFF